MTPRKRKSRVYWRAQGGARRAWFDGRDYADVGGKREPLIAAGERSATTDPDVATQLAAERLAALEAARQLRPIGGTRLNAAAMARLHQETDAGAFESLRAAGRAYGLSDVVVGRILRGSSSRPSRPMMRPRPRSWWGSSC